VRDARASNPRRPRLIHFLEIKCCESISHITASDAHKKSGLSTMECKTLYLQKDEGWLQPYTSHEFAPARMSGLGSFPRHARVRVSEQGSRRRRLQY
jgi:hypothetical protein